MIRLLSVVFLALLLFPSLACDSADEDLARFFGLVLFEDDQVVAEGQIEFNRDPQVGAGVGGNFLLTTPEGNAFPPLTITSGTFNGEIASDGTLTLTMEEPGTSDSGVYLEGPFSEFGISGEWGLLSIAGPLTRGTFSASPVQ